MILKPKMTRNIYGYLCTQLSKGHKTTSQHKMRRHCSQTVVCFQLWCLSLAW